jgi:hypothetical protein
MKEEESGRQQQQQLILPSSRHDTSVLKNDNPLFEKAHVVALSVRTLPIISLSQTPANVFPKPAIRLANPCNGAIYAWAPLI